MAGSLDGVLIEISCATCGRTQSKAAAWVRVNRKTSCPCGATTDFDGQVLIERALTANARKGPASYKNAPPSFGKRR